MTQRPRPENARKRPHGPMDQEFSEEALIDYVRHRLGYPLIDVELMEENYLEAIQDAFELYSRYNPLMQRLVIPVDDVNQKYYLPYIGRGIAEVQLDTTSALGVPGNTFSMNLGDGVVSTVLPYIYQSVGVDQINEIMIYNEMMKRIFSWDFQWEEEGGTLYVQHLPTGTSNLSIIYLEDHNYQTLPRSDRDWVKRFTLAICKQMAGEVRHKYPLLGPAGQAMIQRSLDLLQEGQQEEASLRTEILRRARPLPPTLDGRP